MKTQLVYAYCLFFALSTFSLIILTSCQQSSEKCEDSKYGFNGSFEIFRNGLPVNWNMFTPKTVKHSDFDIIADLTDPKDGIQSLHFVVRKCNADGGIDSPGFFHEFDVSAKEAYHISFWVKNFESEFLCRINGAAQSKEIEQNIIRSKENIDSWKLIEYVYTVPEKMNKLRLELNILSPGSFWIDDFKIDKINN